MPDGDPVRPSPLGPAGEPARAEGPDAPTSFPHPTVLEGGGARLEPLHERHLPALTAIAEAHADAYALTSTPADAEEAERYFRTAFAERDAGRAYPFAVFDTTGAAGVDAPVGCTRFADAVWRHRHAELGYTWYRPDLFGAGLNVACKHLMLRWAFGTVRLHRVQIHADVRNDRSVRAIRALGAVYEGVLRSHMVRKDGTVRDTIVFGVVRSDWPDVDARLRARLARHGRPAPAPDAPGGGEGRDEG